MAQESGSTCFQAEKHERTTRSHFLTLSVMLLALVSSACSANFHTAFRNEKLPTGRSVVSLDAKQRAVLVGTSHFCSEPSPDVFSVIAQALTVGGSFSKSADPTALQAALNVAFSSAEQGSTIPRTQTINMLRELMFRTCERYLNGGLSAPELSVQAIRDQRLMVSILAIEQLTGAVTARSVAIGATGSAGSDGAEAVVRLDDALKEVDASVAAVTKARADYDKLTGTDKKCEAIAQAIKDGTELSDEQKPLQQPCLDLTAVKVSAEQREVRARQHHAALQQLANRIGGPASTATSATGDGAISGTQPESMSTVAQIVKDIVLRNFTDSTEVLLFCLRSMREISATVEKGDLTREQGQALQKVCVEFLQSYVSASTVALEQERSESLRNMIDTSSSLFDAYWPRLQPILADATRKRTWLTELALSAEERRSAEACFAPVTQKDAARACFIALPSAVQRDLVSGGQ